MARQFFDRSRPTVACCKSDSVRSTCTLLLFGGCCQLRCSNPHPHHTQTSTAIALWCRHYNHPRTSSPVNASTHSASFAAPKKYRAYCAVMSRGESAGSAAIEDQIILFRSSPRPVRRNTKRRQAASVMHSDVSHSHIYPCTVASMHAYTQTHLHYTPPRQSWVCCRWHASG